MMRKMKNKKGFTLVEIIVVLVILAILAAIAVPSVIGYVNEAKESRYIQEAHSIYTVVETEVAKYRATDDPSEDDINDYIKDILSGNTIATADNNQLKGIIAKKTELDDVDVERNGNTYKMYWISDDDHRIEATLTKNKDVKIVSTDSNHNFD